VLRPVGVPEVPVETAALAWKVHPRGTDEMRVRDALGPLFADEDFTSQEFEDMYASLGQPGLSPALLAMVTVLQFLYHLSDRDAAQAVADRISWKYMLGLELEDTGFDFTVLCEFRTRLAAAGRADALLSVMLERLKQAGLVRAGGRVRTDSTHVLACVRRPGPDRDPRRGRARRSGGDRPDQSRLDRSAAAAGLGRALRPQGGDRPAAWPQARLRRQADRADRCRRPAPAGRPRHRPGRGLDEPPAPGADPARPVGPALPAHARRAAALQGRRRATPAAQRIHSPYDADARYSTKGKPEADDVQWVGSKAHLSESCDDQELPDLVTDVHTTPATDPDVVATTPIQDKLIAPGAWPRVST